MQPILPQSPSKRSKVPPVYGDGVVWCEQTLKAMDGLEYRFKYFSTLQELEQKVEYWMEKYDKDVEAKQHELDVLKASKAKDLERLQELTKQVSNLITSLKYQ